VSMIFCAMSEIVGIGELSFASDARLRKPTNSANPCSVFVGIREFALG